VRIVAGVQVETYWQSDGPQPHLVNIQFHRRASILQVSLYLDYRADESYTPKKLCIRAGTTLHDLRDVRVVQLEEPVGWVNIALGNPEGLGANRYKLCARTHIDMHTNTQCHTTTQSAATTAYFEASSHPPPLLICLPFSFAQPQP
jgi:hypothetical protein